VFDNHLIHQIEAMLKPINLDDEHLQVDLIKRVGIGGEYLTQRETLKYTRSEYVPLWPPHNKNLLELIHNEARGIMDTHTPPPLPDGALEKINDILHDADQSLIS
jgi:trimethylamine--corrinoid protein Co-methyltransferase